VTIRAAVFPEPAISRVVTLVGTMIIMLSSVRGCKYYIVW
jgi:hypothetical protein